MREHTDRKTRPRSEDGSNADLLERLGPHTTGEGCLYLKRLAVLDREVLAR